MRKHIAIQGKIAAFTICSSACRIFTSPNGNQQYIEHQVALATKALTECSSQGCLPPKLKEMHSRYIEMSDTAQPGYVCMDSQAWELSRKYISDDHFLRCPGDGKSLAIWLKDLPPDKQLMVENAIDRSKCHQAGPEYVLEGAWFSPEFKKISQTVVVDPNQIANPKDPLDLQISRLSTGLAATSDLRFLLGFKNEDDFALFGLSERLHQRFRRIKNKFERDETRATKLVISSQSTRKGKEVMRPGQELWAHTEFVKDTYVVYISPNVVRATFLLAATHSGLRERALKLARLGEWFADPISNDRLMEMEEEEKQADELFLSMIGFFMAHELAHVELSSAGLLESDEEKCDQKAWEVLKKRDELPHAEALECLLFTASDTRFSFVWAGGMSSARALSRLKLMANLRNDGEANLKSQEQTQKSQEPPQ